jgi:iron complex outermembrane recepter protein
MNLKSILFVASAIAYLFASAPAWSETTTETLAPSTVGELVHTGKASDLTNSTSLSNSQSNSQKPSTISQESPSTTPESNQVSAKITGVKLETSTNGINITLNTETGKLAQPTIQKSGRTLVADIPNATLTLAEGKEFRASNPAGGIELVTVTQISPAYVRVSITGTDEIPEVLVTGSETGLVLSATPVEDEVEIVVTAQKREERPQDVPISLTVIPRQQIADSGIRSTTDIANNTPNFVFQSGNTGRQFAFYSLRGLSNSNFLARKDTLGFYVDEVPYEYGAFIDFDLADLERIEVLRGPQSTLYGRNSQAGVVNIFTRQPTNDPEFRASATYGSYNDRDIKFSLSGPLIKDTLLLRVAGGYRENDGFYRNTFLNESAGRQSTGSGRLQLLWKASPQLTVSLNSTASSQNDGDVLYTSRQTPLEIQSNIRGLVRNNTNTQALKVAYDAGNVLLTSITTRRFSVQEGENDGDYSSADLLRANYGFDDTVWTQELRLQSSAGIESNFRWTLGAYVESSDFKAREGIFFSREGATGFGLPTAGTDLVSGEIAQKTYAVFGQIDYKPIDPLTITAGLRFEASDFRLSRRRSFTPEEDPTPFVSGIFNNVTASDSELLPRVALQYQFSPAVTAYASITRGYKPGTFNYRADVESVQRIRPERSWNYEIGVKTSFFDNKLTANLAAFTHQIENYQVALADNTGFFRNIVNAGVGITGLEFEVNATPFDGFSLTAGIGISDAKFTNYVNPFTNVNLTGNRLPFASEFTYNLAAQYRDPSGIFGRLELRGVGTTFFDDTNLLKQDPYAIVNARIGYETKNYGIYLFANNLFDTRYTTGGFLFPPPNVIVSFGAPVTYGVQMKLNF